jgi:multiple sugar transport system permease protein
MSENVIARNPSCHRFFFAKRGFLFWLYKAIVVAIVLFGAFLMLFPYVYMISLSFRTGNEVVNNLSFYLIPKQFTWSNYSQIFTIIPLASGFINTFTIEFFVVTIGTFTTSLAAFAFARLRFPGKNFLFFILLGGMMVPYFAVMTPQFTAFTDLNLYDTLWPLILPGLFGNVAMMFFVRQYALSIPDSVYEAAEIDGCGFFRQYFDIFLPLVRPALAAQVIFWFLGIWNDILGPDIYLPTLEHKTIQVMIAYLNNQTGNGTLKNLPIIMAGSVLSSVPTLILYATFQKYFVNTFMLSSSKD